MSYLWNGVCFVDREQFKRPIRRLDAPRHRIKPIPKGCVYYLCDGDTVLYVGATIHLRRRVSRHRQNGIQFNRVLYDPCPVEDCDRNELTAIRRYRPKLNEHNATIWPSHGCEQFSGLDEVRQDLKYKVELVMRSGSTKQPSAFAHLRCKP